MPVPAVTLHFAEEKGAPTLQVCLEQLLQNLNLEPEGETQDEAAIPFQ